MTFNFSDIIFKAQDAIVDSTGIALNGSGEEQMISLWQLIWGYDSMTDEYSLTSMVVMTLLFTFSIVAVYIFIERFLAVQRALKGKSDFMHQINSYVTDGKLDAAKQMCQSTDNPIARMVEKG